jgi:4-hydroxy-4-methyl-2-oxoglutarate aldolase
VPVSWRQVIRPGDAIVADDDGVCVVPRVEVEAAVTRSGRAPGQGSATRLASGELGLDIYGLRPKLAKVEYITAAEYARRSGEAASA